MKKYKKKFELRKKEIISQIELATGNPGPSSNVERINFLQKQLQCIELELKAELKKYSSNHLCWPHNTSNGELRTMEKINEILNIIEAADNPLERHVAKGIVGRSLLMDQENFDYIKSVSAEYMHSVCLGAVRRMTELTFKVGQTRSRTTKRKLSDPSQFNVLIRNVQLTYEFSRRCRNLDFAVLKASEFRNIILFFFTIVIDCIDKEFSKERRLWLQLAFIVRACVLTNEEFSKISNNTIISLSNGYYKNHEATYGSNNCTYSIHIVGSHILEIRGDVPLSERSAFVFENFYAEMKNLFCPGTPSPLKQVLRNCLMKRQLQPHKCKSDIKYSKMPSPENIKMGKENNHSIYVYHEVEGHCMYNIIDKHDDDTFTCIKQGKFEVEFDELRKLNWSQVGVYRLGPTGNQHV